MRDRMAAACGAETLDGAEAMITALQDSTAGVFHAVLADGAAAKGEPVRGDPALGDPAHGEPAKGT